MKISPNRGSPALGQRVPFRPTRTVSAAATLPLNENERLPENTERSVTRLWDDGKGHFSELMRGYIVYTWFSFALVKAPPHPVSSTNTTNRNRRFDRSLRAQMR